MPPPALRRRRRPVVLPMLLPLLLLLLLLPAADAFGIKFGGGGKDKDKGGAKAAPAAAAAAAAAKKAPSGPPPQVEILTEANFWEKTGDGATWLVDFYAPWCGHCVRLSPILDEVAPVVSAEHGLRIGKVDATQEAKIAKEFGVTGYPTLKVLQPGFEAATPDGEAPPGTVTDYEGPRSKEAFVALAERMAAPSPRPLSTPEELGAFQRAHPVAFLLALPAAGDAKHKKNAAAAAADPERDARLLGAYQKVARGLKASADFALVSQGAQALLQQGGTGKGKEGAAFRAPPFLAKLEQGEEPVYYPLGQLPASAAEAAEAVRRWVVASNHPLVSKLEAHNFRRLGSMGKLMAIAVLDPNDAAGSEAFIERLKEVGRAQRAVVGERFVLGHLDGVKWKGFVGQFGIQPHQLPRLFVLDFPAETFYYDPEVDEADEIETFLLDIAAGKVPAQRQGGLGQAASLLWSRLAEWYPWSLGLLFPIGILLALCLFPGMLDSEEEALREPRRQEGGEAGAGAGGGGGGGGGEGEDTAKDAVSKKNE